MVREAYPEQPKTNPILSAFKNLVKAKSAVPGRDKQFLRKFSETYSAGFRYHPMLKDYLRTHFDVMVERPGTKYLNIKCGDINRPELIEFVKSVNPDIIAVLGSSVIKQQMILVPVAAMLNIHSGLSPYYRGTWSYGWPIVNREPEYIGVTVHHVNAGIDTGDIIYQTRPRLENDDDLNSIFLKVIAEGIELMTKAIEEIITKRGIVSYPQTRNTGRLYQMKDFDAGWARACLENLDGGLIGDYLSMKEERDSKVKLSGYMPPLIFR